MARKYEDPLSEAAYHLGRKKGARFAVMLINDTTARNAAETLIEGYENSDEEIMDLCPNPLSGEWADDPTPMSVIEDISRLAEAEGLLKKTDIQEAMDAAEDVLDVYESGYREAFWEAALKLAKAML